MKRRSRRQREEELAREIQDHLDLEAEEHRDAGSTPDEARRAAMRALGNPTRIKEEVREMWGWTTLEAFGQDPRFALRLLIKSPGFSAVAILTLALGIGANTAIFTVVNGLMVKPLPFKDPERLMILSTIFQRYNTDRGSVSYSDILDWKKQTDLFEAVSAYNPASFDITSGDEPERIRGVVADREYFRVLTDPPLMGRTFRAEEDEPKANRVVVLSYGLWMRRFGGDQRALGSTIELGGEPHKIIGVMPKDSTYPDDAEIFKPLGIGSNPSADTLRRDNHVFRAVARMKPGVSIGQAQAKLTAMGTRVAQENSNRALTNWKIHTLRDYIVGSELSRTLWILLGAVLLILLIACVNVANLLLARGAVRQGEVAIRNALGAGWRRLASQSLVESLALAFAGGLLGMALGYAGSRALVRFAPEGVPRLDNAGMDLTVLAFTFGLCVLTAVVFGIVPAVNATRRAPAQTIREGGRSSSDGVRARGLRSLLVVSELALAVILLSGAGLLIRSFTLLQKVDPGFPTDKKLTMTVALPRSRYAGSAQVTQAFQQIIESVRRVPGVHSASGASSLPVGGGGFYLGRVFLRTGQPEPPASSDTAGQWSVIQPGYFQTMGIPIVAGRAFNERDTAGANPVIVISQSMARQMFPNESPLGRRIRSWRDENVYREIVGIVGDLRYFGLSEDLGHNVYVPHAQDAWPLQVPVVRTEGVPRAALRSIQSAIWSYDSKLAVSEVKTMDEIIADQLARPRFAAFLLGAFAATALLMAAIGIYGLMSYAVAQQTKEIGIRIAIGAPEWDILRKVAGRALMLACTGVAAGLMGDWGITRLMRTLLFGVSPTDAATFVAASALLILVAVVAAYVPARRASKIDPLIALRHG